MPTQNLKLYFNLIKKKRFKAYLYSAYNFLLLKFLLAFWINYCVKLCSVKKRKNMPISILIKNIKANIVLLLYPSYDIQKIYFYTNIIQNQKNEILDIF